MYHRASLTAEEVVKLLEVAKSDGMVYDIVVAGISTGLRLGDVCCLKWESVNLRENTLQLIAHKTDTPLYLPIMELFRAVLEKRLSEKKDGVPFVFPEAEKMWSENKTGISWRVKKVFAIALDDVHETETTLPACVKLNDALLPEVLKSINAGKMTDGKRSSMTDFVNRYHRGESVRTIERNTEKARSTVSNLLAEAQRLSGFRFVKSNWGQNGGMKAAIAKVTREKRKHGMKSASRYDYHCLRTSFVTLLINRGFSIDKLRALTGHSTVEIVLKHYFKPRGTDYSNELTQIMPEILTTTPTPRRISEATVKQLPMSENQQGKIADLVAKLSQLSEEEIRAVDKFIREKSA